MDETIRRLRWEAQHVACGKGPTAIRYPAAFRAAVVAVARPERARGVPVRRLARAAGLPSRCLGRWLAQSPAPALRPVTVALAPTPGSGVAPVWWRVKCSRAHTGTSSRLS